MHLYLIYNRNKTCLSYQYPYLYHLYISTVDILLFSNKSIILSLD